MIGTTTDEMIVDLLREQLEDQEHHLDVVAVPVDRLNIHGTNMTRSDTRICPDSTPMERQNGVPIIPISI